MTIPFQVLGVVGPDGECRVVLRAEHPESGEVVWRLTKEETLELSERLALACWPARWVAGAD